MRLDSDGTDEIGQSKKAFNSMISSIESSISSLNTVLAAVSQGDLSQKIDKKSKGDLEQLRISTNRSVEMLQEIIKDIKKASMQANLGADELAKSSQSLASGASQQAASLEEISSSLSEVESQTKTNSDHATSAKSLCNQMLESIETGNKHMKTMISSMNEINETSNNVNKIIKVIDEIAFQTNLLALNATIEAARAGEAGKGFAVVANEIKDLAKQTAQATLEIRGNIESVQDKTDVSVQKINAILGVIKNVNDIVSGIAAAVEQQAAATSEISLNIGQASEGIGEVNQNVGLCSTAADAINNEMKEVNHASRDISEGSHQVETSASQLNGMAETLNNLVGRFKI